MQTLPEKIAAQRQKLYRLAKSLTSSNDDAEDLTQDTIYRALQFQEKFIEGSNLEAWLYTTMRNLFIDNIRRSRKVITIEGLCEAKLTAANDAPRNLATQEIRLLLCEVTTEEKDMLELQLEGFKYSEIAELRTKPLHHVGSTIMKAKKKIAGNIDNKNYGE